MGNNRIDYEDLIKAFRSAEEVDDIPKGYEFHSRGEWMQGFVCKSCRELETTHGPNHYLNGHMPHCSKCGSKNDYSKFAGGRGKYAQSIAFREVLYKKYIFFGMLKIGKWRIFEVYDQWTEKWLKEKGFKTRFVKLDNNTYR